MSHHASPGWRLVGPWRTIRRPAACGSVAVVAMLPALLSVLTGRVPEHGFLVGVTGVATAAALLTAAALAGLARGVATPDPWRVVVAFSATAALGLVLAATLVATPPAPAPGAGPAAASLTVALLLGYGVATGTVRRHWPWSTVSRAHTTMALVVLGAAQAALGWAAAPSWLGPLAACAALGAALLLGTTVYGAVRADLVADRRRSRALRDRFLEEEAVARRQRDDRHAMRNMVAGICMASELLEDELVEPPTRRRLEHSIHEEAEQLRLMLDRNRQTVTAPAAGHEDDRAVGRGTRTGTAGRVLRIISIDRESHGDRQIH